MRLDGCVAETDWATWEDGKCTLAGAWVLRWTFANGELAGNSCGRHTDVLGFLKKKSFERLESGKY